MVELYFTVTNTETTAYALVNITNGDHICGELEDHAGLMGIIKSGLNRYVSWYLALIEPQDIAGPGVLVLVYEQDQLPGPKEMAQIFDVLDLPQINAQSVDKPSPEDYPSLYERLERI